MKKSESAELPVCEWDGFRWSTRIAFREWPKDLAAYVEIVPPSTSLTNEPAPPSAEQSKALAFLTAPGAKIGAALLQAAKDYHAACVKRGFKGEDGKPLAPLRKPTDLNKQIKLTSILVHDIVKAKHAYVGLEFSCAWDREHGFGVMLHKRRIVKSGAADSAILEWIATGDGGAVLGEAKKPAAKKAAPKQAKPAAKKPSAKHAKPAAKKPAAKKTRPAAKKPAAKKAKPAAKKPAAKKTRPAAKRLRAKR